jgi:hypothetical protein
MGIQTDCETKEDFINQVAIKLSRIIESNAFEHDWKFQLEYWLPQIIDIASSYGKETFLVIKTTVRQTGVIDNSSLVG